MNGRIIHGDARTAIPAEPVQLIITSPPYNVGKGYDVHDDEMTMLEWQEMVWMVLAAAWERLVPGGTDGSEHCGGCGTNPAIAVGHMTQEILFDLPGADYRGAIVWDKGAAAGASTAWGSWQSPANPVLRGTYEMIYVIGKDQPSREGPGTYADISKAEFMAATIDVWRDTGTVSAPITGHPAAFPVALARRLIQLYSWPRDTVLDPFFGSGTVGVAAEALGRDWIGVDISKAYCEIAAQRCSIIDGEEVHIESA